MRSATVVLGLMAITLIACGAIAQAQDFCENECIQKAYEKHCAPAKCVASSATPEEFKGLCSGDCEAGIKEEVPKCLKGIESSLRIPMIVELFTETINKVCSIDPLGVGSDDPVATAPFPFLDEDRSFVGAAAPGEAPAEAPADDEPVDTTGRSFSKPPPPPSPTSTATATSTGSSSSSSSSSTTTTTTTTTSSSATATASGSGTASATANTG